MTYSRAGFGVTVAGEFSAALNDCGLFMIGVNVNSTNPECPIYENWENYNDTMKQGVLNEVLASMDALGDWFFWTWKVITSPYLLLLRVTHGHHDRSAQIKRATLAHRYGLTN